MLKKAGFTPPFLFSFNYRQQFVTTFTFTKNAPCCPGHFLFNFNNVNVKIKKYNFVYKTTNIINGKIYIGVHSTDKLDDGYLGSGYAIKDAIKKYGKENFYREIIKFFNTRSEAFDYEKQLVDESFIKLNDNYNLDLGGTGCNMIKIKPFSEETLQKLREMNTGEKNHFYGKKHTDEARRKIKEARARQVFSKETLEKRGKKISIAKKGKKHSDETKMKLSEAGKGKKHSDETKNKMSKAHLGHSTSDETRKKISEANKKMWTTEYKKARYASFQKGWETRRQNNKNK